MTKPTMKISASPQRVIQSSMRRLSPRSANDNRWPDTSVSTRPPTEIAVSPESLSRCRATETKADPNVERALRHYDRSIRALQTDAFSGLSDQRRADLLSHLRAQREEVRQQR